MLRWDHFIASNFNGFLWILAFHYRTNSALINYSVDVLSNSLPFPSTLAYVRRMCVHIGSIRLHFFKFSLAKMHIDFIPFYMLFLRMSCNSTAQTIIYLCWASDRFLPTRKKNRICVREKLLNVNCRCSCRIFTFWRGCLQCMSVCARAREENVRICLLWKKTLFEMGVIQESRWSGKQCARERNGKRENEAHEKECKYLYRFCQNCMKTDF